MKNENPSSEAKEPVLSGSRTDRQQTVDVVQRNWRAEVETAQVYRDLAGHEKDEKRRGILLRMAEAEERHAQRWEKKLVDLVGGFVCLFDHHWRCSWIHCLHLVVAPL